MRTTPKNPTLMLLISMLICISSAILLATVSIDTRDVVYPLTIGVTFVAMTYSIINAIFMAVAQYRYIKGADAYPESKRIRLTSTMYRQASNGLLIAAIAVFYFIFLTVLKDADDLSGDDSIVLAITLVVSLVVSSLMHECAKRMPDQPADTTSNES